MMLRKVISLLISLTTVPVAGCMSKDEAPQPLPSEGIVTANGCMLERFTQPEELRTRSLDLLFVTDTSGSLDQERARVADGIDGFVSRLPDEVDFRVGVMPAHGSRSRLSGRLFSAYGRPTVLRSGAMSPADLRSHLRANLTQAPSDDFADGGEEGLYSLTRAVADPGLLLEARHEGFFRTHAALAVVFISDENDICAEYGPGETRVPDPEGMELPAFERDCAGIRPILLYNHLRKLQAGRPLAVGAIAYTDPDDVPRGGENEYGFGYLDLVRLANGVAADIRSSDYPAELGEFGELVATKMKRMTEFKLRKAGIDRSSIRVKVDDHEVGFEYDRDARQVRLAPSDAGRARSTIEIAYCPSPGP